jgi:hypothetical protein
VAIGSVRALDRAARYCLTSDGEDIEGLGVLFQDLRGDVTAARGVPSSVTAEESARARARAVVRADALIELLRSAGY